MTTEEAIKKLENFAKHIEPNEEFLMAIKALKQTSVLDQIKWERDIAISQLKDLGYGLGEKPRAEKTATFKIVGDTTMHYECSICGGDVDIWDKFCKHCGAKMVESQESEEEE